jgi:hypothetical protein
MGPDLTAMRRIALWIFAVLPGAATVIITAYFLAQDWRALTDAFAQFQRLARSSGDLETLFIAEAEQNAHRINCFAEGVGVLLGAILAAIGTHGLCVLRER